MNDAQDIERTIPTYIIESCRDLGATWAPREGGFDRENVIVAVAELEQLALEALIRFTRSKQAALNELSARKALGGLGISNRSSLDKLAQLLYVTGEIDRDLFDDLRQLYRIRVRYAHEARRRQLNEEADLQSIVRGMPSFRNNRDQLEGLPTIRHAFRAIERHLKTRLERLLKKP